ncbi:SH3 domain-containing C40 family peptidase [Paenibacillus sp. Marseille-Q4541]|uniref:SH3 domain-containing C40 family peptidase n=1 Tax=Paenibacillus sp. Marseille-Q4541 TaxID=2831522 RepID=UPI001BA759B1|nr:SH3 domain-containing C40 family peptidase [Paenibacillus sp. Marseille-Q4541]
MKVTKKILTASITATLLLGAVNMPVFVNQAYAATTTTAEVIYGVNLRKGPSTSYSVIRMLQKGETVTVLSKYGTSHLKVKDSKGNTGYISSSSKYTKTSSGSTGSGSSNSSSSATVEKVISAGSKYMGTPYKFGADRSSTKYFDCSSFVRRAFIDGANVTLPADSRQQATYVKNKGNAKSSISSLKRGDLMFFMSYKGSSASSYSGVNKSTATVTHVGIYLGNNKILHTYSTDSGGVRTDTITGKHWEYRFLFGGSAL